MAMMQKKRKFQRKIRYNDDALKCAICHQTYTEPKCLPPPCSHVFCKMCITKQLRYDQVSDDATQLSFRCPTCKHCFPMQAEQVVQLKDDAFLLNYLQPSAYKSSNKPNQECSTDTKIVDRVLQTDCTSCDNGVSSVAKCTECKATFCESCLSAHNSFKFFHGHHIIYHEMTSSIEDDNDESSRCTYHNTVRLSHYCSTCKVVVCSECISVNHEYHFCVKLFQAAQVLNDKYGKLNTRQNELVKTCTDIIQYGTETYEQAVDKVRDTMIEIVNQTAQDLKNNVLSAAFEPIRTEVFQLCWAGISTSSHKSDLDLVKHRINQLDELESSCQRLETLTTIARAKGTSILSEFVTTNQHQKSVVYDICRQKLAMSNLRLGVGDEDDVSDIDKQVLCLGLIAVLGLQQLQLPLNETEDVGLTIDKLFVIKLTDVKLNGLCSNANGGLTVFDMRKKEMLIFDKSLLLLRVVSCDSPHGIAFACIKNYVIIASDETFYIYTLASNNNNHISKRLDLQSPYATQLAIVVTGYDIYEKQPQVTQVYSEFDALNNKVSVQFHSSTRLPQPVTIAKYASTQNRRILEFKRSTITKSEATFVSVGDSYVPRVDNKLMIAHSAKRDEYAILINGSYAKREVIKLYLNGNKVFRCPLQTDATISFQPFGMCIDDEGRVLIGDAGARAVHIISKDGGVIGQAQFGNIMEKGDTLSLMAYHGSGTLSLATEEGKIWIVQLRVHQL
jgi:hypothetical protein